MKKSMKTILRTSVAVLLLLSAVLCFTACGGSSAPKVNDASGAVTGTSLTWSYTKDNKTLTIGGSGEMPNPASVSEVAWASVRAGVEKVVVGTSVTTVGDYAFYHMPYLKSVSLPTGITSIGKYAFGFCSALEEIALPDSVTKIGDSAFEACTSLKSIVVSPNVTDLGARAFALCSSMTDATVVANVTEIRAETFYNCKALKSLILHTSVERADDSAFALCAKSLADAERRDTVEGSYEIVITYENEDGSEAFAPVRETKQNGENYFYTSPVKEGFTAEPAVVQGTVKGSGVSEKVVYKKNAETEPAETAPVETTAAPTEPEESSKTELIVSVVILAVVVIGIAVGAFLLLRNNKKNDPKNAKKK